MIALVKLTVTNILITPNFMVNKLVNNLPTMPNYFSTNLVFLRKLFRVSQAQLASQLTKGQTTIGNWENGLSQPSVEDLLIIKHFFGILLDHLIEIDLRSVQVNEVLEMVKKPGIVQETVQETVQVLRKKAAKYTEFEPPLSVVNEDSQVEQWATLKLLRQIDQKVDQLLLSAGNKPTQGAE